MGGLYVRLIDFFDKGAEKAPERVFLTDAGGDGSTWTYAEAQAASHRVANALIAAGVSPGTRVAIYANNAAVNFIVLLGVFRAGAVWTFLNARNSAADNAYILDNTGTRCLFYHADFAEAVDTVRTACPKLRTVVCLDREDAGAPAFDDWLAAASDAPVDVPRGEDDLAVMATSGGTTGRPKGILLSNRVFSTMIATYDLHMPLRKPPVHLVAAPMSHAAGALITAFMAHGCTNVILPGFDAVKVMEAIQEHGVTVLFLPPTAIYMLLAHGEVRQYDYGSLEYFIYAAAPMSVDKLRQAWTVFGPVMTQSYGQAEAPMNATYMSPAEHGEALADPALAGRLASCGRETAYTRLAIMADDGRLLGPGEAGEIVLRGGLVMSGYHENADATAEASAFGWHHTGDIGMRDADGYVYIVDRKKDMIISGGFNIYPSEIEQVVWSHPAVQDCAVVGVPDDKWGEAVTAVVQLKPGASAEADDIAKLCRERLGAMKTPKQVEFWPDLPRSAVGKVLKRDIREKFWAGQSRRV
jgi:acyl-CoA synthetase (AMP-forming)/AMP-acid ligase II